MDNNANKKKSGQLGMPHGTAQGKLRKSILFSLIQKLKLDKCFQCGHIIYGPEDLSIEHKVPWMDSDDPVKLFFDLDNIAFSHLKCNIGASRKIQGTSHGAAGYHNRGCRCEICKQAKSKMNSRHREKIKLS